MAITEEHRHQLYTRLEEVLGVTEATTLMSHLPPVGWADVATKHDLAALETRLDAKVDGLRSELYRGLHDQTRTFVTWLLASNAAIVATAAAVIAAVRSG